MINVKRALHQQLCLHSYPSIHPTQAHVFLFLYRMSLQFFLVDNPRTQIKEWYEDVMAKARGRGLCIQWDLTGAITLVSEVGGSWKICRIVRIKVEGEKGRWIGIHLQPLNLLISFI